MPRTRATTELLIGFGLSLALHATLIVGVMRSHIPSSVLFASFLAEPPPRVPADDDLVPLGLDESMASTNTWIGFEESQPQVAPKAEIEQGAFTSNPGRLAPDAPPASPLVAVTGPAESISPEGIATPALVDADTPRRPVEIQPELQSLLTEPPKGEDPAPPQQNEVVQPQPTATPAERPEVEPPPDEPKVEPAPAPAAPPAAPTAVPAAAPGGEPGQPADQESDPASIIDVSMEQLTLGKPLAAQGLQIKPRKPVFTTLMLLTAAPDNPTAELRFRRNGEPVRVTFLVRSGDPRIDEAVENSLYKWRAAGRKLKELKEGQTLPVRIRILLH